MSLFKKKESKKVDTSIVIKLFVSQPYTGKTDDEVLKTRDSAYKNAVSILRSKGIGYPVEVIDQYHESFEKLQMEKEKGTIFINEMRERAYMLAYSLQLLSTADFVYFVDGWENSSGCVVEKEVADKYRIPDINKLKDMDYKVTM